MKVGNAVQNKKAGFTIVELLTVMGVIAVLIGLLVPALNMVKDYAKQVQQSAQFHSIEVALDLYRTEFGDYPASNDNSHTPVLDEDPTVYTGANKLAEALVGLDFLGYHPKSDFRADGLAWVADPANPGNSIEIDVYAADVGNLLETPEENVKARGGKFGAPFIELENANAFRMQDVYANYADMGFRGDSVVLCDVYAKKRNTAATAKTGMPILYYKARTHFVQQDIDNRNLEEDDIYYYWDNFNLLSLGTAEQNPIDHPLSDTNGDPVDLEDFEDMLVNQQVLDAAGIKRPYRAGSYILISAGKDGLYGTADDITNFKRNDQ